MIELLNTIAIVVGLLAAIFSPIIFGMIVGLICEVARKIDDWRGRHLPDYRTIQQLEIDLGYADQYGPKTQPWDWPWKR